MTHGKQLAWCLCKYCGDGNDYSGCLTFRGTHLHNWQPVDWMWLKEVFGLLTTVFKNVWNLLPTFKNLEIFTEKSGFLALFEN